MAKPSFIPEGFSTVTPYLIVKDGNAALEFYKKAFGATPLSVHSSPGGGFMHAEFRIGSSMVMLGEHKEAGTQTGDLPLLSIYLYVEDADTVFGAAIKAGASEVYPVGDKPYGNREGGARDPFGITWWIGSRIEVVSDEELSRRMQQRKQ